MYTEDDLKKEITKIVDDMQGLKMLELLSKLSESAYHAKLNIVGIITSMIDQGELMSVEYALKNSDYRVRCFILPKDTKIIN